MKKIALAIALLLHMHTFAQNPPTIEAEQPKWWKEAIVYQIYPRSFKDSDGDGIGDLKGIISELDYIKSLGVNTIWLNPIYTSPNDDNGYDVSDYTNIMKDFGTMADFDMLLKAMHQKGLKLVMDLVVNHSSDEHKWFQESKKSRTNPYRDYYHWWPAENGKPPYRYSLFDINHDAWKYDSTTNSYYLHYFSAKQPDLKWENKQLRQEVYNIMHFWAQKGIDGFRLDAFQFAAKDTTYPAFPKGYEKNFVQYYGMQGNLHGYLQEMYYEVLSKYNVMSVAEGAGNTFEDAHNLVDADRKELNMAYAFEAVDLATHKGYRLTDLKNVFAKWDSAFAEKGWLSIFLASHDCARLVSRYGNDKEPFRKASSKLLSTLLLTLRGTPYYYNGDELGMKNIRFSSIDSYRDVQTINGFVYEKNNGGNVQAYLDQKAETSRDNARTPFQWNANANAGFTTGTPWIAVNPDYKQWNRAAQEADATSTLHYFRKLTALRQQNPLLVYGKFTLVDKSNSNVFAYTREWKGEKWLIALNFSEQVSNCLLPFAVTNSQVLLNNLPTEPRLGTHSINLDAYQAVILKLPR
ncbi:MAG: alpha-glucosidase [Bacteroidetes bacterium]|nr:MAG: alpha-glucosidase [Bacteroidota bacterium]